MLGLVIDEHHSTCELAKQQQAGDSAGEACGKIPTLILRIFRNEK